MNDFITVEEDGYLYLEGRVLLEGDLVEMNFGTSDWWIGQVERIGNEFRISVYGPDGGHLLFSHSYNPIRAKRLADRPTFLPPFGEDWKRKPQPPEILVFKNSLGEIDEKIIESGNNDGNTYFPSVTALAKPVFDKLENKIYFWDLHIVCPHCKKVHHYEYPEHGNPTNGENLGYFEAHCDGPGYFVIVGEVHY